MSCDCCQRVTFQMQMCFGKRDENAFFEKKSSRKENQIDGYGIQSTILCQSN